MDVAAVSADLPRPLDSDRGVATVSEWLAEQRDAALNKMLDWNLIGEFWTSLGP
jgi:hypothetical protein